jgi:hypothetical protein
MFDKFDVVSLRGKLNDISRKLSKVIDSLLHLLQATCDSICPEKKSMTIESSRSLL